MEDIEVNVRGGEVRKYKRPVSNEAVLKTLKEAYGVGNLEGSDGFDVTYSGEFLDAGLYTYVPITSSDAEGVPASKKPKTSPVEHLDSDALFANQCRYMRYLLAPPDELPIAAAKIKEFLATIRGPLPVLDRSTMESVMDDLLVKLCSPGEQKIAKQVDLLLSHYCTIPVRNETDSSHILRLLTGDFLLFLNKLAPAECKLPSLETSMDSGRNVTSAAVWALVHLMRPDYTLYLRNALILRWENKLDEGEFKTALEENTGKLKVWSPLYYGELPYVIGGCCAGRSFQWLKLSPKDEKIIAEPISDIFDIQQQSSVAKLLHSVVQMHRLLQKLQQKIITPIPIQLYKEMQCGTGTIVMGPEYVLKTLVPKLSAERVAALKALYISIKGSKYLIQLRGEILQLRSSTKLILYPVGDPRARPFDLKQLVNATHDMLHCLSELHKAGYTHRDLRWENCIRRLVQGEMKWIIIDLEYAGEDGQIWEGAKLVNWDEGTLNRNQMYTKRSDMYELGKLIVNWLDESREGCTEGKRMRALGERMMAKRGDAAKMLQDICKNPCARCRIFNA